MAATIKLVAAHARVSAATVSRVLNGNDNVSPDLRDRVLTAAADLRYRPNGVARSLRRRETQVLGLIISDITNPFFTAMVRGVEDAAQEAGYSVVLANADEDPAKEARYLEVVAAEQMAGLVLSPAGDAQPGLDLLADAGIPVVTIDRRIQGASYDSVTIDNRRVAQLATTHLIEQGWQRIGFVAGPSATTTARERLAGYRAALRDAGRRIDRSLVRVADNRAEGGYDATCELLRTASAPDALLVSNNLMTVGALDALDETGYEIPGDFGLVGFDDVRWALGRRGRITTVEQPTYEIGRNAGELLLDRVRGYDGPARRTVLPADLAIRDSSLRADAPVAGRRSSTG